MRNNWRILGGSLEDDWTSPTADALPRHPVVSAIPRFQTPPRADPQAKTLKVAGRGEYITLAATIFRPGRELLDGKPLGSGGP